MKVYGDYFYGNKISDYGIENGYVDYCTLAKSFDAVLNNDIIGKTNGVIGYWEQESGFGDDYDTYTEIYQWYIVSYDGAEILREIDEIVFYNEDLDMYTWGVTHYGTSWCYVLTDIKIEKDEEC